MNNLSDVLIDEYGITHFDLCKVTAERFIKDFQVAVYEYQSFASGEFPDVLCFKGGTTSLFEIKVSRSDFLADSKKESRRKWKPKVGLYSVSARFETESKAMYELRASNPELFFIEAPHLGRHRYYVCPWGMIEPKEVPESWGLYWYRAKDGRFFHKKRSGNFRRNIHAELSILSHAMRKYASEGPQTNILINTYLNPEEAV